MQHNSNKKDEKRRYTVLLKERKQQGDNVLFQSEQKRLEGKNHKKAVKTKKIGKIAASYLKLECI